jgi:hypothetical protein
MTNRDVHSQTEEVSEMTKVLRARADKPAKERCEWTFATVSMD